MNQTEQRKKSGLLVRAWDSLFARAYSPGPGGAGFMGEFPDVAIYPYAQLESYYKVNPWVNRGVHAIADAVAALPLKMYREVRQSDGTADRKEIFEHEALDLLAVPNAVMSGSDLKRALSSNLALSGEAWLYTEDGTAGTGAKPRKPTELRVPRSEVIAPIPDKTRLISGYRYLDSGITILPHFIAGAKTWNPENDYRGLPPMQVAKDPVLLEWYMTQHNTRFFKKGGYVGLYASTDKVLTPDTRKAIEEGLTKYTGYKSQGGVPVMDAGLKLENAISSAKDGDFIGLDKMAREQVLAILGVPPVAVGVLDFANYANSWQQMKMFYQLTVVPICSMLADALNSHWLPVFWPEKKGLYLQFDYDSVQFLTDDAATQAQIDASNVRSGIMTINEVRSEKDLPPVEWGDDPPAIISGFGAGLGLSDPNMPMSTGKSISWISKAGEADYEIRRARQRVFDQRTQADIPLMSRMMIGYWMEQEHRVLQALGALPAKSGWEHETVSALVVRDDGAFDFQEARALAVRKIDSGSLGQLFNTQEETAILRKMSEPVLAKIVARAGKQSLIDIGSDVSFNVTDPRVQSFISNKVFRMANDVSATTQRIIHEILIDASLDNSTVDQVAQRIRDQYADFERYRALRVARTEMGGAHNGAAVEAYKQDGGVAMKGWASIIDDATRDSHVELDGVEVALDQDFPNGLSAPGVIGSIGPADVPGEIINCRCAVYGVAA